MNRIFRILIYGVVCAALLSACSKEESPSPQKTAPAQDHLEAVVAVERATVFSAPDRNAAPLTYLYEREKVTVTGKTADEAFLLLMIEDQPGWILTAQVDTQGSSLAGLRVTDAQGAVALAVTPSAAPVATSEPSAIPTLDPNAGPTRVPLPTRTPLPTLTPTDPGAPDSMPPVVTDVSTLSANTIPTVASIRPGGPPPLTITLPEGWQSVDILVPFRTQDTLRDLPMSIYSGPLPGGVTGYIYLFWGFPNIIVDGEYNLYADGVQLLRGSFVDSSCNLGVYNQNTFYVGGQEATGAYYTADGCEGETDTAGWFVSLRVYDGSYAFFTAVEPLSELPNQLTNLQAILDTVQFVPPEGQ